MSSAKDTNNSGKRVDDDPKTSSHPEQKTYGSKRARRPSNSEWSFIMRPSPNARGFQAPRAHTGRSYSKRSRLSQADSKKSRSRSRSARAVSPHQPTPPPTPAHPLSVHHRQGDLFSCEPGSVMIHACNCLGSWGAGVAAAFRKKYPQAYKIYVEHCREFKKDPGKLVGTTLLIPPVDGAEGREGLDWIGCLFTRENYGKPKGKTQKADIEDILEATKESWEDLLQQVTAIESKFANRGDTATSDHSEEIRNHGEAKAQDASDGQQEESSEQVARHSEETQVEQAVDNQSNPGDEKDADTEKNATAHEDANDLNDAGDRDDPDAQEGAFDHKEAGDSKEIDAQEHANDHKEDGAQKTNDHENDADGGKETVSRKDDGVGQQRLIREIVMPKINGGLFKVPWRSTEEVLKAGGRGTEGLRKECWVYTPDE